MEKGSKKKSKKVTKKTVEPKFQMDINLDQEQPSIPQKVEKIEEDELKIIQVSYVKAQREEIKEKKEQKIEKQPIDLITHLQNEDKNELRSTQINLQDHVLVKLEKQNRLSQQRQQEVEKKEIFLQTQLAQLQSHQSIILVGPKEIKINELQELNLSQGMNLTKTKPKKQGVKAKNKKKESKPAQKNNFSDIQLEQLQQKQQSNHKLNSNQIQKHEEVKVFHQEIPIKKEISPINTIIVQSSKSQQIECPFIFKKQQRHQLLIPSKAQEQITDLSNSISQNNNKQQLIAVLQVNTIQDNNKQPITVNIEQDFLNLEQPSNLNKSAKKEPLKGKKKKTTKAKDTNLMKQQIKFDLQEEVIEEKHPIPKEQKILQVDQQIEYKQENKQIETPPSEIKQTTIDQTQNHQIQYKQQVKEEIKQLIVQEPVVLQQSKQPVLDISNNLQNKQQQEIQFIEIDLKKHNQPKKPKKKNQNTNKKPTKQSNLPKLQDLIDNIEQQQKKQQNKKQDKLPQAQIQFQLQTHQQIKQQNKATPQQQIQIKKEQEDKFTAQQQQKNIATEQIQITTNTISQHIDIIERVQQSIQTQVKNLEEITIKSSQFTQNQKVQDVFEISQLKFQKVEPKKKPKKQKKQKGTTSKKSQLFKQSNFQLETQPQIIAQLKFVEQQIKTQEISPQVQILNISQHKKEVHQQLTEQVKLIQVQKIQQVKQESVKENIVKQELNHNHAVSLRQQQQLENANNQPIKESLQVQNHNPISPIVQIKQTQKTNQQIDVLQIQFQHKKASKKPKTKKKPKQQVDSHKNKFTFFESDSLLQEKQVEKTVEIEKFLQIIEPIEQKQQQIIKEKQPQIIQIKPQQIVEPQKQQINTTVPQQKLIQPQIQEKNVQVQQVKNQQVEDEENNLLFFSNDSKPKVDKNKKNTKKGKISKKPQAKNTNFITNNFLSFQEPEEVIQKKVMPIIKQKEKQIVVIKQNLQVDHQSKKQDNPIKEQVKQNKKAIQNPSKLLVLQKQNGNVGGNKQIVNQLINLIRFHNDEQIRIMRQRMQMLQEDILARMIRSKDVARKVAKKTDYQWIVEENIHLRKQYQSLNGSANFQ